MKKVLLLSLLPSLAMAEVPHTFQAGTPAKADEVNANFTALDQTATTLATKIAELEAALEEQDSTEPFTGGAKTIEVDCTDAPEALQLAYHEHINYRDLSFALTGTCYGHIEAVRGSIDEDGNYEETQIKDQTINIYSKDSENIATIIPNDETNSVFLMGGFGGGLYLSDLHIQASAHDFYPVLFSRNGHGGLTNVTITGANNEESTTYAAVWLQEGAQAYISNLTTSGTVVGLFARNNASVRFVQDSNLSAIDHAIRAVAGVSVNHRATLTLNSESDTALDMMASTWSTENGHLVANSKTIAVSNSSFALNNGALEAETLDIVSSNVDFNGDLNTTTINNWNSNLRLFGTVTADTVFSSNGTTFINATREVQSYTCVGKSVLDVDGWAVADILTNTEGCANSDIWTSIVNAQRTALDL